MKIEFVIDDDQDDTMYGITVLQERYEAIIKSLKDKGYSFKPAITLQNGVYDNGQLCIQVDDVSADTIRQQLEDQEYVLRVDKPPVERSDIDLLVIVDVS